MIKAPKLCCTGLSAADFEELVAEGELLMLVLLMPGHGWLFWTT